MTPLIIGNLYLLHSERNGKVDYHFTARFNGYEFEHDGEVKLAVFVAEMDGEKIYIDMDFIQDWTITDHQYSEA